MDVRLPDGTVLQNVPDGMSKADLIVKLKSNGYDTSGLEPAAVSAGKELNSIPRQIGLTARYGLEGLANAAQIGTEPIRYVTDRLTGSTGKTQPLGVMATKLADSIGLPTPQGANERVVGDATRLLAGTAGNIGGGLLAQRAGGMAGALGEGLASAPVSQMASAVGAGLAGGASREAGGSPVGQIVSSAVGGLAGAGAVSTGNALAAKANAVRNALMSPQEMDGRISGILTRAGVDYTDVPERVRQSLRQDMGAALRADQEMDPAAVARLLDFRRNNLTPTRGMVTLDPVQITKEQNLAKMAANSSDGALHGLPRIQNQNNAQLITNLNQSGANSGNLMGAGASSISAIQGRDAALQGGVRSAYDAARAMPGADVPLDRASVVNAIYGALGRENKLAFLPENVSNMLNTISKGVIRVGGEDHPVPFDANALDNLMTTIATAQRGTSDGNVRAALGIARRALDATPITPIKEAVGGNQLVTEAGAAALRNSDSAAGSFMDALRNAKQTAAQRFNWQESGRPIEAALGGAQPDDFIKRFVIGGTLKDASDLAANAPTAPVKDAIVNYLKNKALNGAADEVGKFSQSAFNKELKSLADSGKLRLFFSNDEIEQLRSMGRAASYMQAQPVGSAVNNSNSGALLLGKGMDALNGIASKLPFGQSMVVDPLQNISISLQQRQAANVLPSLLLKQQRRGLLESMVAPGMAAGGLLAAPGPNN